MLQVQHRPLDKVSHLTLNILRRKPAIMMRSLCSVWIVCLLAARVSAHGGTLHPGGPEQNNFIRSKVASCSKWVPASGTLKDSKVVPSAAKLAPVDVKVNTAA